MGTLPKGKLLKKKPPKKLWVDTMETKTHCGQCYDDKEGTTQRSQGGAGGKKAGNHSGLGAKGTTENDEEHGNRPRKIFQGLVSHSCVEGAFVGVLQKNRRKLEKGSRNQNDRTDVISCRMVCSGGGEHGARGT